MANRLFNQFQYSLEKAVVSIYFKFTGAGAGSNVVIDATNSKGIASITKNGDGDYTLNLQDRYTKLLDFNASALSIDGSTTPLAVGFWIKAFSPGTATTNASVRVITYLATPGTPVAPGANDTWRGCVVLSNSSAP